MKQGIVIAHHRENKEFLQDLLFSLRNCEYPVYVVINDALNTPESYINELKEKANILLNEEDGYEMGALRMAYENTDLDEMFLLQDTLIIKNAFDFCYNAFVVAQGRPCYLNNQYKMFLCKYRRDALNAFQPLPRTTTKLESIAQEGLFNNAYFESEWTKGIMGQSLNDTGKFEEKYGKTRMVLENEYVIKWKATWRIELAQ